YCVLLLYYYFFFQAEDGIRDRNVTGVQTCALTISKIPIIKGRCVVDQLITSPNPSINVLIGVPINFPVKNPTTIVTNGVTIISTFVNLYTNFPTSVAHKTAT